MGAEIQEKEGIMKSNVAIALAGLVALASPCKATHSDDIRTDNVPVTPFSRNVVASWQDDLFKDLDRTAPRRPDTVIFGNWKDDVFRDIDRLAPRLPTGSDLIAWKEGPIGEPEQTLPLGSEVAGRADDSFSGE